MSSPSGWYPDGQGKMRYWTGVEWTEHVAAMAPPSGQAFAPPAFPVDQSAKGQAPASTMPGSAWYQRKGVVVSAGFGGVLAVVAIVANTGGQAPILPVADFPSHTSSAQTRSTTSDPEPAASTSTQLATATVTESKTTAPAPPPAAKPDGTRSHPYRAGSVFVLGDWKVALGATDTDATRVVLRENMFNDKPERGRSFIMAPVTLTYLGEDKEAPWISLSFDFVGSDNREYGSGGMEDSCGVIPKSLNDIGDMYGGAKATGNVCVSVPAAAIRGGEWAVEETFGDDPVFVSLR